MARGGFRGRRVPGDAFGGVSTGMSLASRRAWATRAVASKRHFITGQGEVETGCLASDSQICACR